MIRNIYTTMSDLIRQNNPDLLSILPCRLKSNDESLQVIELLQVEETDKEVAKEKTVLSISHRLSTTRGADVIYVMEQGRVIEQGSHAELLAKGGVYATMWEVQASRYA